MATKQHNLMSGADLHVTKIDPTTGTELTTPSEAIYDARWFRGRIASNITASTIANTSSETDFGHTYLVSANSMRVGQVYRFIGRGIYSSLGSGAGTYNFRCKTTLTTLRAVGTISLTTGQSNSGWSFQIDIIPITLGASGSVECQGLSFIQSSGTGSQTAWYRNTAPITLDTTVDQIFKLSLELSVADVANTFTLRESHLEILG